ncbi:MAG: GNAT family N-acetyltransferase [Chromatiales bacterium]|jgi:predicted N-acetyltransferase YhbS
MHCVQIYLRPAKISDLDAINRVIEKAVMNWKLPERVKRLSLPLYRYDAMDFRALEIIVAHDGRNIVGLAAWETADQDETPQKASALLLHGLYVDPAHQRKGIGQQLFRAAESAMHDQKFDGLMVKAQESADGFFLSQGMHRLDPLDPGRHYANRFWKSAGFS